MSSKGEKRPTPKRLFSFDSAKTSSSKHTSSEGETWGHFRGRSKATILTEVKEGDGDDAHPARATSPAQDPFASRPASPAAARFEAGSSARPKSPEGGRGVSPARRWDTLRHHVVAPSSRPSTPSSPPTHTSHPSVASIASARASTPKPSRFPRLGFRQVVDHAKEAHDAIKFAEEILRICLAIRYPPDGHTKAKSEKDNHSTIGGGSSMYLPFMSSSTLINTGSAINITGASKKSEKHQSQSSLALTALTARNTTSLKALQQILLYHSAPPSDNVIVPTYLPHEIHVLSCLLTPFEQPGMIGQWEDERAIAVEAFELVIKAWLPPDESVGAERILWCCKASLIPASPTRSRILSLLRRLLVPGEHNRWDLSPVAFQSIVHSLFVLQTFLHSPQGAPLIQTEIDLCKDLVDQFLSGSYGDISESMAEEEYGVVCLPRDNKSTVMKAIFLEALVRCLEHCTVTTRAWLLLNVTEDYWSAPTKGTPFTALQMSIHSRKLNSFCRASYTLLQAQELEGGERYAVAQRITALIDSRVIPETELLDQTLSLEVRTGVVKVVAECMMPNSGNEFFDWAVARICRWLGGGDVHWKSSLDKYLQKLISLSPWAVVLRLFSSIMSHITDPHRKNVVNIALPMLNDRLVNDPPPTNSDDLSTLLDSLSRSYPTVFFKPLFLSAVSTKEFTVINHLCTITIYSKYVEDFWIRDPEMLSMALLSDTGSAKETVSREVPWAVARIGQSVLMVEFIHRLQDLRRWKESASHPDSAISPITKQVTALETRLAILVEAREKKASIAPSQRMLLCMIFREIRLLTRSLKPASWLQRTINWFSEFYVDGDSAEDLEREVHEAMDRIHGLYAAAQSGARHSQQQRRSTMVLPSSPHQTRGYTAIQSPSELLDLSALFERRKALLDGLLKGFPSKALKLFVVVSPMLNEADYRRIAPSLWESGLMDTVDASSTASACFLIMQCAEKTPLDTLTLIEIELLSSDDMTRLEAVRKLGVLVNWRFQFMSQAILSDRAHRPFKMARIPLPFAPTDMGTTLYIPAEESSEGGEKAGVPVELKKQLAELGWVDEDSGPVDPQQAWIKTPMSMFPISQLDKMELGAGTNPLDLGLASSGMSSPQPSPRRNGRKDGSDEAGVLRRNSTSGGPVASQKRRAIFVPPLANIFIRLIKLLHDPNFAVASSTRSLLLDLMRNDPSLLSRPVMDILAGEHKDIQAAISTLSSLLQIHQTIPPPMSHTIFNHLMGFLKWSSRQYDMVETLQDYGLTLSILASITTQVSGMSFREIRRSKTDTFVVPSGALWFNPVTAPKGPMFPRGPEAFANPFEDINATVISLSVIRTSQNLLFLSLLKKNGQEVNLIRKSMSRFVLPSVSPETTEPTPMEFKDMIPRKQTQHYMHPDSTINTLSLVLARSHLMLLAQIFRAMSRHLSDRNELATMIDGVNRILCTHGHDIGIVGHSMIALMVATTRFRRLFTSRTAYTLFMPALVKVYTESPQHPGIRPAIEYAVNRFYALHRESFLYQSLGIIGQMAMSPAIDEKAFAESVYTLFFSLANTNPTIDAAGIHNVNKGQEREALIVDTAEEKPQTFLAAMRRADSASSQLTVLFPEEYEADRLRMDNFVRLFLTVIAHDLSIVRAQHYLRLLRLLAPHLYNCSASTRSVFLDGVSALGGIMLKGAPKSKGSEPSGKTEDVGGMENHSVDQTRIQSDVKAMRLDYLHLVLKLGQAGGELSLKVALQYLELVKLVLKDAALSVFATGISSTYNPEADNRAVSALLSDFVRMLLIREQSPSPKAVARFLQNLAPILHGYMGALDFTGIYDTVRQLSLMPVYAGDPAFSQVVVGQICTAGLAACELAASENQYRLLLALPFRTAMIRLLAECVFVQGADVVAEIEKRAPTYPFLAGVVLPLVLELSTNSQLSADGLRTQERHRTVLTSAWLRLLFYAMGACQKSLLNSHGKGDRDGSLLSASGSINGSIRSKSRERDVVDEAAPGKARRRGTGVTALLRSQVAVLAVGLQIVKAIVVRAEIDISSSILGVWERLASFLKAMVSEGSADFATRGNGMDGWNSARASEVPSPALTPTASPRVSAQFNPSSGGSVRGSNMFVVSPSSPSFKFPTFSEGDSGGVRRMLRRPRVLDYMLWSTLEFLWAYRSPLRLQLRLLATEKIVALDSQLRSKGIPSSIGRNSRFSHPPSPRSRRVSAMFLKNRGERSPRSPAASPEVSPLLLPTSASSQQQPTPLSLDTLPASPFLDVQRPISLPANKRRPGYQMSPVTPIERPLGVPRIVHLGPASPSVLRNQPYPVSPSGLLANNAPGNRVSTLGAGLRAGLGGLATGGSGRKKDKDGNRTGQGGQSVTGSDLIRTTKIKSVKLVEGTYRRIRGVQAVMGYDLLLPLPRNWSQRMRGDGADEDDDDSEVVLKSWTKSQALAAISQETKDMLEEFEYWMAVASREEPEDDSDEDEEGDGLNEQSGLEVPAPHGLHVVNDFGILSSGSNGYRDSAPVTPVMGNNDDRLNLLHPHSLAPLTPRQHQSGWQDESRQSNFDTDDSSIHIEVDSTFVDSPNPSPIMTFHPQRRPSHIDG